MRAKARLVPRARAHLWPAVKAAKQVPQGVRLEYIRMAESQGVRLEVSALVAPPDKRKSVASAKGRAARVRMRGCEGVRLECECASGRSIAARTDSCKGVASAEAAKQVPQGVRLEYIHMAERACGRANAWLRVPQGVRLEYIRMAESQGVRLEYIRMAESQGVRLDMSALVAPPDACKGVASAKAAKQVPPRAARACVWLRGRAARHVCASGAP
eukprot:XP_001695689.1 predicted protein [Chlamydomonas reinhardtii]